MSRVLVVAILTTAAVPVYAQEQRPSVEKHSFLQGEPFLLGDWCIRASSLDSARRCSNAVLSMANLS
jgi:hypothetical protein